MSELRLSPEGLFPIPYPLGGVSTLDLSVSGTLQGEGVFAGTPSLFLRLSGCNMRCKWIDEQKRVQTCDTLHALDPLQAVTESSTVLCQRIREHCGAVRHLVVTGGEPLLQAAALHDFFVELKAMLPTFRITVESNATIFAPALLPFVHLWSFSPKLSPQFLPAQGISMLEYADILNSWLRSVQAPSQIQLKFVIGARADESLLLDFLSSLRLRQSDIVLVMPLGATREELERTTPVAVEMAIRHGFRFSPRLQIWLWGNKRGT